MKLLILGGTRFLGRHLVTAARARGHEVTLFNRGQSGAAPVGVAALTGDRDGGLDVLRGHSWDAVVDTSGYVPRVVKASAELLSSVVAHYTFISSLSVLAERPGGQNEDAPVATMEDESVEELTGPTYGPLKALCERAVKTTFGDAALVVRPGLVVGPYDTTDRFPYWPRRIARGGEVLGPDSPDTPVQFVDARDLAEWIVRMAEARTGGTFHTTGPDRSLTLGEFLHECCSALDANPAFTWVSEAFLLEKGVTPFSEMPLWVPREAQGFCRNDCSKAFAAGLTFRPLGETIRDTYEWDAPRSDADRIGNHPLIGASLSAARERELLAEWHERAAAGSER